MVFVAIVSWLGSLAGLYLAFNLALLGFDNLCTCARQIICQGGKCHPQCNFFLD